MKDQQKDAEDIKALIEIWASSPRNELTLEVLSMGVPEDLQHDERLITWVEQNTNIKRAAFSKAVAARIRADRLHSELGRHPKTAVELVEAYVARDKIEARYNGLMTRSVVPWMVVAENQKEVISGDDMEDPMIADYVHFHFNPQIDLIKMERDIRLLNANFALNFSLDRITDALIDWYERAKAERLLVLFMDIEGAGLKPPEIQKAEALWLEVARTMFECSEHPPEYVAAVLKSFIWQVKRKLRGLPVTNHLMPILLGSQGSGKTTFVHQMIEPISELSAEVDFAMITDERNIDIWNHYVMFFDEMGHASRADMDAAKKTITATTLTRRPMRQNGKVVIDQRATMIGCSNKEMGQLIKDPTGVRRFAPIRFSSSRNWEFGNGIDWTFLWQSVDYRGAHPMTDYADILREIQEEARDFGRVERWLMDFDSTSHAYKGLLNERQRIASNDLFVLFRDYEDVFFAGSLRTSKNDWDHEMKRIAKNAPEKMPFEKMREASGVHYALIRAGRSDTGGY